jgi:hypothetical protein
MHVHMQSQRLRGHICALPHTLKGTHACKNEHFEASKLVRRNISSPRPVPKSQTPESEFTASQNPEAQNPRSPTPRIFKFANLLVWVASRYDHACSEASVGVQRTNVISLAVGSSVKRSKDTQNRPRPLIQAKDCTPRRGQ